MTEICTVKSTLKYFNADKMIVYTVYHIYTNMFLKHWYQISTCSQMIRKVRYWNR